MNKDDDAPLIDRDVVKEGDEQRKELANKEKERPPGKLKAFASAVSAKGMLSIVTNILTVLSGAGFMPINKPVNPVPSTFVPSLVGFDYVLYKFFDRVQKKMPVDQEYLACTRYEFFMMSCHKFIYIVFRMMSKNGLDLGDSITEYMSWFEKFQKRNNMTISDLEMQFFMSLGGGLFHDRRNKVIPALPNLPGRPDLPEAFSPDFPRIYRSLSLQMMQYIPCMSYLARMNTAISTVAQGPAAVIPSAPAVLSTAQAPGAPPAVSTAISVSAISQIVGLRYICRLEPNLTNKLIGNMAGGLGPDCFELHANAANDAYTNAADYPDNTWMSSMLVNSPANVSATQAMNARVEMFISHMPGKSMAISEFVDEVLASTRVEGGVWFNTAYDNLARNGSKTLGPVITQLSDKQLQTPSELVQASQSLINIDATGNPLQDPAGTAHPVGTLEGNQAPTRAQVLPNDGLADGHTRRGAYWHSGFLDQFGQVDFQAAWDTYFQDLK
jgi:hypothetical protein